MKPIEDGVYTGVSREDYDRIDRMHFSKLKLLEQSPAHLRAAMLKKPELDTDALLLGRATHIATLEPERFLATYEVWERARGDRRGPVWKAFKAKADAAGIEVLKEDQYEVCKAMADAARADRHAGPYLRNGSAEITILWTHREPANGLPGFEIKLKARIDFGVTAEALVDLKTTQNASPDSFFGSAQKYLYAAQAAMYSDGYAAAAKCVAPPYVIIAVEKSEPHVTQPYSVDDLIPFGRDTYRGWLRTFHECLTTGNWRGYADGIVPLQLPRWMRTDHEDVSGLGLEFEGAESNGGL